MSTYRAYGISLDCDLALRELDACGDDRAPQLSFRVSSASAPPPRSPIRYADSDSPDNTMDCSRCDGGYLVRVVDVALFFISADGTRIVAYEPLPEPGMLRHLLLDSVLPRALNVAGRDALHATAVLTPRGVVGFIGESGAGKSTLAARFVAEGHALVSDDCLVLDVLGADVIATPSYSGLRLLPDAREWMGSAVVSSVPVTENATKHRVTAAHTSGDTGGRVEALYVLEGPTVTCDAPLATRLSQRDAFNELLACSFRLDVEDRVMIKRQFELFTAMATRVPMYRLRIPRSLDAVTDAYRMVRKDLGF
jgi:hypothetical protein